MDEFLEWSSQVPLSHKINDPGDDFSDGVLVAEIIKHFIPNLVDLETYQTTRQYDMKLINWKSLNRMVFKKIHVDVNIADLECVCMCQPSAVQEMLGTIKKGVERYLLEEERKKLFPAAKVKRDHLNQKLESIRSTYFRQRTSHSLEKTPSKKPRGNVLVLPSQDTTTAERQHKVPPMTAPQLNNRGLGEPKTKDTNSVTFITGDDVIRPGHNIAGQSESQEKIQTLQQQMQDAEEKIKALYETLDKTEQENSEFKVLLETYERNMEKILTEFEALKQENLRKDGKIKELQQQVEKLVLQPQQIH